jgi:hypothetical protein
MNEYLYRPLQGQAIEMVSPEIPRTPGSRIDCGGLTPFWWQRKPGYNLNTEIYRVQNVAYIVSAMQTLNCRTNVEHNKSLF